MRLAILQQFPGRKSVDDEFSRNIPPPNAAGGHDSKGNRFDTNVGCPRVDAASGIASWELKSLVEEGERIVSNAGRRSFAGPSAIAISQIGTFVFGSASDVSISSGATSSLAALRRRGVAGCLARSIIRARELSPELEEQVFCVEEQYSGEKSDGKRIEQIQLGAGTT